MQVSRGIEGSVEVGIKDLVFDSWDIEEAIEQKQFRFRTNARLIQQVSRSYQGYRGFLDRSTRYQGGVKIVFKKILEKLDRWQGIEEVSSKLLKPVFREMKNTDMNAIQHITQPMIQSTQKSLKIVSQFKKMSTKISKTHTHTPSLKNFIFQKQVKTV